MDDTPNARPALPRYAAWVQASPDAAPLLQLDLDALPRQPENWRSRSFAALLRRAPFCHLPPDTVLRVVRGKTNCFAQDKTLGHWRGVEVREDDAAGVRFARHRTRPNDKADPKDAPGWPLEGGQGDA